MYLQSREIGFNLTVTTPSFLNWHNFFLQKNQSQFFWLNPPPPPTPAGYDPPATEYLQLRSNSLCKNKAQ